MNWFVRADDFVKNEAAKRAAAARAAGITGWEQRLINDPAVDTVNAIRGHLKLDDEAAALVASELARIDSAKAAGGAGRESFAQQYAPQMNRGPFGMTRRGTMEAVNEGIATNAYVRRGALPVAIVGGGALLTEGAQQLLALMGFIKEGNETAARANESPLA